MKKIIVAVLLVSVCALAGMAQAGGTPNPYGLAFGRSSAEEILDGAYRYIQQLDQDQLDVPQDVYDFYFAFDRLVNPHFYESREGHVSLDQDSDTCPEERIEFDGEEDVTIVTCGTTRYAANDCTFPYCRNSRDVFVHLDFDNWGLLRVTTTGSAFDTYLCLWEDNCCGNNESMPDVYNNNNPYLCNGQRLAAGFEYCVDDDNYILVLDGAGPAAFGSYCLTIEFEPFECED
ncbi:hypothetical protein HUU59_03550 [bacterium]|nr:hypothetical protein [bacterium]